MHRVLITYTRLSEIVQVYVSRFRRDFIELRRLALSFRFFTSSISIVGVAVNYPRMCVNFEIFASTRTQRRSAINVNFLEFVRHKASSRSYRRFRASTNHEELLQILAKEINVR